MENAINAEKSYMESGTDYRGIIKDFKIYFSIYNETI
jgi:hypothetical protein